MDDTRHAVDLSNTSTKRNESPDHIIEYHDEVNTRIRSKNNTPSNSTSSTSVKGQYSNQNPDTHQKTRNKGTARRTSKENASKILAALTQEIIHSVSNGSFDKSPPGSSEHSGTIDASVLLQRSPINEKHVPTTEDVPRQNALNMNSESTTKEKESFLTCIELKEHTKLSNIKTKFMRQESTESSIYPISRANASPRTDVSSRASTPPSGVLLDQKILTSTPMTQNGRRTGDHFFTTDAQIITPIRHKVPVVCVERCSYNPTTSGTHASVSQQEFSALCTIPSNKPHTRAGKKHLMKENIPWQIGRNTSFETTTSAGTTKSSTKCSASVDHPPCDDNSLQANKEDKTMFAQIHKNIPSCSLVHDAQSVRQGELDVTVDVSVQRRSMLENQPQEVNNHNLVTEKNASGTSRGINEEIFGKSSANFLRDKGSSDDDSDNIGTHIDSRHRRTTRSVCKRMIAMGHSSGITKYDILQSGDENEMEGADVKRNRSEKRKTLVLSHSSNKTMKNEGETSNNTAPEVKMSVKLRPDEQNDSMILDYMGNLTRIDSDDSNNDKSEPGVVVTDDTAHISRRSIVSQHATQDQVIPHTRSRHNNSQTFTSKNRVRRSHVKRQPIHSPQHSTLSIAGHGTRKRKLKTRIIGSEEDDLLMSVTDDVSRHEDCCVENVLGSTHGTGNEVGNSTHATTVNDRTPSKNVTTKYLDNSSIQPQTDQNDEESDTEKSFDNVSAMSGDQNIESEESKPEKQDAKKLDEQVKPRKCADTHEMKPLETRSPDQRYMESEDGSEEMSNTNASHQQQLETSTHDPGSTNSGASLSPAEYVSPILRTSSDEPDESTRVKKTHPFVSNVARIDQEADLITAQDVEQEEKLVCVQNHKRRSIGVFKELNNTHEIPRTYGRHRRYSRADHCLSFGSEVGNIMFNLIFELLIIDISP